LSASNKTYDAGLVATLTGSAAITALTGDVVTLGGTAVGAFANKSAANGKAVTVSGNTISGTDAGNYNLLQQTGLTANISKADLSVTGLSAGNKTYDTNLVATLGGTAAVTALTGDTVTLGGTAAGAFANKSAANGKAVTVTGVTLISGGDNDNYNLLQQTGLTANISKADISAVTGITAANKVYDRLTTATLTTTGAGYTGRMGSDVLNVATATGNFSDKTAATGKTVNITGITLDGTDAGNYNLTTTTASTTADISKADLTVTGLSASNKTYDTTLVATLTGTAAVAALGSDVVTLGGTAAGAFADKSAANGKAVTVTGVTLSGTGADNGNYNLIQQTGLTANISKADLTVTGLAASNKIYDSSLVATLTGTAAVSALTGDVVTLGGTAAGAFADKNVGTGKTVTVTGKTITGTDAGNYNLLQQAGLTANISKADLSVTGLTARNKTYDGQTTAAVTTTTSALTGKLGSDDLLIAAVTGNFADKNVGTAKNVSISGITLGGTDAGNYTLTNTTASASADITRLSSVTWIGGTTGDWFDPANWAGGAVPDLSNVANVVVPSGVVVSFNNTVNAPAQAGTVNVDSIGTLGGLDVSAGTLSVANTLQLANYVQSGGLVSTGGNFAISNSFSQSGGSIAATGDVGITQMAGSTTLGNITAGGTLGVSAAGDIAQVAGSTIAASGATTLTATNGNIAVDGATNDFGTVNATGGNVALADINGMSVVLAASGNSTLTAGDNLAVSGSTNNLTTTTTGTGTTSFGRTTVAGNLNITSAGTVSQTGPLNITGTADFSAAGQDVTLANASNNFVGAVSATGNNLSLADANGITLGNITSTGTLGVAVTAGGITQASGSSIAASGETTLTATAGEIVLDSSSNTLGLVNASGSKITLADSDGFELGNVTTSGDLVIRSTTGSVTIKGTLDVSGSNPLRPPPVSSGGTEAAVVVAQNIPAFTGFSSQPSITLTPIIPGTSPVASKPESSTTTATTNAAASPTVAAAASAPGNAAGAPVLVVGGFQVIELSSAQLGLVSATVVVNEGIPASVGPDLSTANPGQAGQVIQIASSSLGAGAKESSEEGGGKSSSTPQALIDAIQKSPPGRNLFVIDGGIRLPDFAREEQRSR
jgi:hypothetical protein